MTSEKDVITNEIQSVSLANETAVIEFLCTFIVDLIVQLIILLLESYSLNSNTEQGERK